MRSSNLIRSSGLLAVLGSVMWTATWILVFTADGTREVLGFSERGWRTLLLNPAMLFFMTGLVGFQAKQAGRSGAVAKGGFIICLLGLGTMLLGNIVPTGCIRRAQGERARMLKWVDLSMPDTIGLD